MSERPGQGAARRLPVHGAAELPGHALSSSPPVRWPAGPQWRSALARCLLVTCRAMRPHNCLPSGQDCLPAPTPCRPARPAGSPSCPSPCGTPATGACCLSPAWWPSCCWVSPRAQKAHPGVVTALHGQREGRARAAAAPLHPSPGSQPARSCRVVLPPLVSLTSRWRWWLLSSRGVTMQPGRVPDPALLMQSCCVVSDAAGIKEIGVVVEEPFTILP